MTSPYYEIKKKGLVFSSEVELWSFVRELLAEKYKVIEMKSAQGELIPYHAHAHKELVLMIDGNLRMIIEEDIVDISTGDILMIEPWAIHLVSFPVGGGARFYLCFPRK